MNAILEKILQPSFLLTLVAALKLIGQPFGLEIPDQQANEVVNGVCALGTIIGIWMNHAPIPKQVVQEPTFEQQKPPLQP